MKNILLILSFLIYTNTVNAQWDKVNNGLKNLSIFSILVSDSNIFAGTGGGGVFLSTDSGATWNTDGVLKTLVSGVDYTLNTASGVITFASDYVYSWIESSWSYEINAGFHDVLKDGNADLEGNVSIVGIILTISLVGVVLYILMSIFQGWRNRI
jgi:hypothetical protein